MRFYQLKLPQALGECSPDFLDTLRAGLLCMPESLYRAYVFQHDEVQSDNDGEGAGVLSFYQFGQDSAMLMDVRNMLAALVNGRIEKEKYHISMVKPPQFAGVGKKKALTFEQLAAMLSGVSS